MKNKQGENLKILRESFGEKQSEVMEYLNSLGIDRTSKNRVTAWESGESNINYDIAMKLAEHYLIPFELFTKGDISPFQIEDINYGMPFIEKFDLIFPVFYPEDYCSNTCGNEHFRLGIELHKQIIAEIKEHAELCVKTRTQIKRSSTVEGKIDKCFSAYEAAKLINDQYASYTFSNRLSLFFLANLECILKPALKKLPKSAYKKAFSDKKDISQIINCVGHIIPSRFRNNYIEMINTMLDQLKMYQSCKYIVNYFQALSLILGFADNTNGYPEKIKTGFILMFAYSQSDNILAKNFMFVVMKINDNITA